MTRPSKSFSISVRNIHSTSRSSLPSCFRWTWFLIYLKQNLFHSRMIRPVVGGGGPTCLKQPLGSDDANPVQQIERKGVGEELTTYLKQNLFHSRMIRPVVGGGGPTCLKQPLGSDDANPVQQIERKGVGEELTTYLKQNLFHSRMIRTVVGGGGPACLKQTQKERPGNGSQVIVRSGFKAIIQPVGVLCAGRSSC